MGTTEEDDGKRPPSWIDEEFIQTALRSSEDNDNLTVESIVIQPATSVGDNYASQMYRVSVKLQGRIEKHSLIIKILQTGPRGDMFHKSGAFQTETNVLSKTIPRMYKMLEQSAPGKYQPLSPKCLYSGDIPTTYLVLEDLSVYGFRNAPRQKGLNLEHCALVIQTLARFHASSIALHSMDSESLKPYGKSIYNSNMNEFFESFVKSSVQSLLSELKNWPDYHTRYQSKLQSCSENLFSKVCKEVVYMPGKLNVLLHADPWLNNMMFRYNKDSVVDLRLVDFQQTTVSSPAYDLQFFLQTSANEEVREHHFDRLLAEYHSTLTATLSLLDCDRPEFTLDQLHKDFHDCYFYGLYAALTVLPLVMANSEAAHNIEKGLENAEKILYGNEHYVKTIKTLLPTFEEKGCFEFDE